MKQKALQIEKKFSTLTPFAQGQQQYNSLSLIPILLLWEMNLHPRSDLNNINQSLPYPPY
jgi:hypothetical protein